jgi:hypothetical protein
MNMIRKGQVESVKTVLFEIDLINELIAEAV